MAEKNNQRVKLSKMLLKNSLIEIMHEKPVEKITIKELCENAGINRSTFYLYYTDPVSLLVELENEVLDNAKEFLGKVDSNQDTLPYLITFLDYIKDNSMIFNTLLRPQENLSFQTKFMKDILAHLKSAVMLNCPPDISEYIYNYVIMGSLSVIQHWIQCDYNIKSNEMATLIYQLSNTAIMNYVPNNSKVNQAVASKPTSKTSSQTMTTSSKKKYTSQTFPCHE
ncbi:TetR/AcrR family transcriptional regulator [Lachnoclostridium sp.]|uniref:TetR/AcrR family transcriptional regulator n=1 Tax=Lachnoclostridium sp. TaxID=2028282 RepID=UPI002897ECEE|nr:TetR/AcrR family transcriptional regulator C-terminal domain-containing protein [Lachnoclostridium sp.]